MDGKVSFARAAGTIISLTPSSRAVPSEPLKRVKAWKLAEAILRPAPRLPPDDWARANRIYPETSGLPGPRDPSITPYIVPVERAIHAGGHKRVVMVCGAQMGKSLALDTPLPTPMGWTTMGEVRPGDVLFDERGEPCRVAPVSYTHLEVYMSQIKNKHIPSVYLRASASQRLELLRGLMDTDGGVSNGQADFCSKYEALALQVFDLAVSLGYKPRIRNRFSAKYKTPFYCVHFLAYQERSPFNLSRKTAVLGSVHHARSRPYLAELRYIRAIAPIDSVPVRLSLIHILACSDPP